MWGRVRFKGEATPKLPHPEVSAIKVPSISKTIPNGLMVVEELGTAPVIVVAVSHPDATGAAVVFDKVSPSVISSS